MEIWKCRKKVWWKKKEEEKEGNKENVLTKIDRLIDR